MSSFSHIKISTFLKNFPPPHSLSPMERLIRSAVFFNQEARALRSLASGWLSKFIFFNFILSQQNFFQFQYRDHIKVPLLLYFHLEL